MARPRSGPAGGGTVSHDVPWPHTSACHALAHLAMIGRHGRKRQVEKTLCQRQQTNGNAGLSPVEIVRRMIWRKAAPKTSEDVTVPTDHKGRVCVRRIKSLVGKHTDVTASRTFFLGLCAGVNPEHQIQCDTEVCHQLRRTAQAQIYVHHLCKL